MNREWWIDSHPKRLFAASSLRTARLLASVEVLTSGMQRRHRILRAQSLAIPNARQLPASSTDRGGRAEPAVRV